MVLKIIEVRYSKVYFHCLASFTPNYYFSQKCWFCTYKNVGTTKMLYTMYSQIWMSKFFFPSGNERLIHLISVSI